MRKYSIGAMLLDKDNPAKVLARSAEPLLTPADADREGYVPNVVYTCGGIVVGDSVMIPYGFSDSGIGFVSLTVADLLASMTWA